MDDLQKFMEKLAIIKSQGQAERFSAYVPIPIPDVPIEISPIPNGETETEEITLMNCVQKPQEQEQESMPILPIASSSEAGSPSLVTDATEKAKKKTVTEVSDDGFEIRRYQRTMIELAKEINIIACLPTGSGKTYIALKLTEHYLDDVRIAGKKIIFIAGTIPLLRQQCDVFQRHTPFKCNAFSGKGTGTLKTGTVDQFQAQYKLCEIMLMTPQYLYNLITHGYIHLSDLALIIIDECHHSLRGNPINRIMKIYVDLKQTEPDYSLPRILGLSATVIKKNVKVERLDEEIARMEKRMDCVALTYDILAEVMMHSTTAQEQKLRYCNSELRVDGYSDEEFLFPITNAIDFLENVPMQYKYDEKHKRSHPRDPSRSIFNGKSFVAKLMTVLEECVILNKILGPYAILHIAAFKIRNLKHQICSISKPDNFKLKMYQLAVTALKHSMLRARTMIPSAFRFESIEHLLTDKIAKTLWVLMSYKNKVGTDEELCGLLFVERRTTALALKEILLHLRLTNSSDYGFIYPEVVVGANKLTSLHPEDRVSANKQAEIIEGFRKKKYNLLICTSVLEEGIDVPSCNLVLRFDSVYHFASYMQSMGRARKKNANYCILINDETYGIDSARVNRFGNMNVKLNSTLKQHLERLRGENNFLLEEEYESEEDEVDIVDFCPNGNLGAKVTAYTCIALVSGYANKVCSQKNVITCWDWYDKFDVSSNPDKTDKMFKASITLPPGSAVKNLIIEGKFKNSKSIAKKSAFMEAAMQIYEGGGFDLNFVPV